MYVQDTILCEGLLVCLCGLASADTLGRIPCVQCIYVQDTILNRLHPYSYMYITGHQVIALDTAITAQ